MLVSVIIPVRNAEAHLSSCLEQLKKQTYRHESLEILVIDGASQDRTREIAKTFSPGKIRFRLLTLQHIGRSQGLNAGIREARGDAICRLDVRTRVSPDYIERCVHTLNITGASNVGGVQVPDGVTLVQKATGLAMSHPFGAGNAQFRIGRLSGFVDTVYLGFFRREIFDRVGLFDEVANVISEDSDMNQRIRAAGGKVYLDVNIRCYYVPRETLGAQFALYYRYGGARAANVLKHRSITSVRQLAAPFLIAILAFGFLLGLYSPSSLPGVAAIASLYLAIDFAVSVQLAARSRQFALLAPLLIAFPAMHFGYGLGFWRKLVFPEKAGEQWKG